MRLDRLIGILSLLLQRERVTAAEMAELFEVSRRTVLRDVDELCRAGIPLVTIQGAGGGISIMDGYRLDRTVLTSSEMQAILAGLRSLDSVSGTRRYAQLMEKLSAGSGTLVPGGAHMLIDLSSWYRTSLPPKIELISAAIEQRRTLRFAYFSPSGESIREAEPYYLVFHWSSWYVWAWCRLRKNYRLFKLGRMAELEPGETFEPRGAPLPQLEPEHIFPARRKVTVLFEPRYKWRLVEEYGSDSFTTRTDGRLRFTVCFPDDESVLSWLLTFGGGAELTEPEELREKLSRLGRELAERYSKGGGADGD